MSKILFRYKNQEWTSEMLKFHEKLTNIYFNTLSWSTSFSWNLDYSNPDFYLDYLDFLDYLDLVDFLVYYSDFVIEYLTELCISCGVLG